MAVKTLREMQAADAAEIWSADGIAVSVACTPAGGTEFSCDGVYRYLGSEPVDGPSGNQVDHMAQVEVLETAWSSPSVDDRVVVDGITWRVQAVLRRHAARRKLLLTWREARETGTGSRQGGVVR